MDILIAIWFTSGDVIFILYIDRQVWVFEGSIPLLESTPDEPVMKGLKPWKVGYTEATTDTPTKSFVCSPHIMRYKAASCKDLI